MLRRKFSIDTYAPIVAKALAETGVDIPLDVVKQRLRSPNAKLVLPDPKTLDKIRLGELSAASVETVETTTEKVVTSARDFARIRPLSVRVELGAVPKEIRGAVR